MDFSCKESNVEEYLSPGMFEIPREPAVVINGLPPVSSSANTLFPCPVVTDAESRKNAGFGQWFEGRDVDKLFGDKYCYGKVTKFDEDTGWFKVKYEDGDTEDLEWHELDEVLLPLDINIPLKKVATKVIKRNKRCIQKFGARP